MAKVDVCTSTLFTEIQCKLEELDDSYDYLRRCIEQGYLAKAPRLYAKELKRIVRELDALSRQGYKLSDVLEQNEIAHLIDALKSEINDLLDSLEL